MAPKKGRRGRRDDGSEDEEISSTQTSIATDTIDNPAQKKTSKKKQKKKNAKLQGDWSDEERELSGNIDALQNDDIDEDSAPATRVNKQKGKKKMNASAGFAALEDDPDVEAEQDLDASGAQDDSGDNSSADHAVTRHKGSKKGKTSKKTSFAVFQALEDDPEADAEESLLEQEPVITANGKSSLSAGFAALDIASEEEGDGHPAASVSAQALGTSAFAALDVEEDRESTGEDARDVLEQESVAFSALSANEGGGIEEGADVLYKGKASKKGKGKTKGRQKAAFNVEDIAVPSLQAATVTSVKEHPNADKLKVCQISTGSDSYQVVTNAATVKEGMKTVFASVGSTTPGSNVKIEETNLRGVDSFGMLCSAFDIGWADLPDGVLVELPADIEEGTEIDTEPIQGATFGSDVAPAFTNGKKKGKKQTKNADVPETEEQEEDYADAAIDFGKKKGKKKKPLSEAEVKSLARAAFEDEAEPSHASSSLDADGHATADGRIDAATDRPAEISEKKKKKSKKTGFDPDALLAEAVGSVQAEDAGLSRVDEANGASEAIVPEKKKKGKKKATFDVDSILAEAVTDQPEAPQEIASEASNAVNGKPQDPQLEAGTGAQEDAKRGKKKKGKAGGGEEDLDALLAEFGVDTEATGDSKKSKKKKKGKLEAIEEASDAASQQAVPASTSDSLQVDANVEADEDEADEAETDGKELTAAQKKKLKKKAKDKAKKGDGEEKKGPAKKESAAVRKLREEMERQRAAQEAAQRAEEERIRKEEETARLAEEEAKQKEEEKQRRKEERNKNRAELKRQGLLLTGKEKQEAERLAAMREQFLKSNPGMEFPTEECAAANEQGPAKKRPIYGKKKPTQKKQEAADDDQQSKEAAQKAEEAAKDAERQRILREQEVEEKRQEAALEAQKAAEAQAAAEQAAEEDNLGWDELDVEDIKLPGQESPEPETEEADEDTEEEKTAEVETEVHASAEGKAKPASLVSAQAKKARTEAQAPTTPALEDSAPKVTQASAEKAEEESQESEEEESDSEEETESEEETDSDEDDSSEYTTESMDSEEAREERLRAAREARAARTAEARRAGNVEDLRSPICCILGHVDTGKTKLLDNIRRTSVQEGEAGGITQQIGATYVPGEAIKTRTEPVRQGREFGLKLPGLLIIDTPGHESFTNLRSRGSSLCDIAILVVDIMHGLEPQTIESINLLKQKKTPFIVALNKVDRLFEWDSKPNSAIREALDRQQSHVKGEFETNLDRAILNLNEQGLNVALYWKNPDPRKYVNIVPTSAITGEGIPDMLQLVVQLTQKMMTERLMFISELQCTVLEVKVIEGLGTTIDVVLVNGVLREGDQIVLCGLQGPIVTSIRSLLTPHPLKELRVRGSYLHHKEIKAAQGIKIAAPGLESAVAGTQMLVVQRGDSIQDLKAEVMGDMTDIFKSVDKTGEGVCVQASTLGSLEALLEFLRSDDVKIPVSGINIGPVHRRDVMRASTMLEKGRKKFAVILAFDVPVTREAQEQATNTGVRIFTADIIYHLFDQFSAYLKEAKAEEQQAAAVEAVFPVELKIMPTCIFNAKDPIILGCSVEAGIAKVGTPLCVPTKGGIMLGRIASMEINHKAVEKAKKGDNIALKIEATSADESAKLYGRHFDFKDLLVSRLSRKSIDLLKAHFRDELERPDWQLVVKLKKVFGID